MGCSPAWDVRRWVAVAHQGCGLPWQTALLHRRSCATKVIQDFKGRMDDMFIDASLGWVSQRKFMNRKAIVVPQYKSVCGKQCPFTGEQKILASVFALPSNSYGKFLWCSSSRSSRISRHLPGLKLFRSPQVPYLRQFWDGPDVRSSTARHTAVVLGSRPIGVLRSSATPWFPRRG